MVVAKIVNTIISINSATIWAILFLLMCISF